MRMKRLESGPFVERVAHEVACLVERGRARDHAGQLLNGRAHPAFLIGLEDDVQFHTG